jgi:cell division protein FtsB
MLASLYRRKIWVLGIAMVSGYGLIALRGPQGLGALLEKHREIRQLEEENAAKVRQNKERKDRVERLQNSVSEQEMEIRKQLKLLRPGETTFILPDAPKADDPLTPETTRPNATRPDAAKPDQNKVDQVKPEPKADPTRSDLEASPAGSLKTNQ